MHWTYICIDINSSTWSDIFPANELIFTSPNELIQFQHSNWYNSRTLFDITPAYELILTPANELVQFQNINQYNSSTSFDIIPEHLIDIIPAHELILTPAHEFINWIMRICEKSLSCVVSILIYRCLTIVNIGYKSCSVPTGYCLKHTLSSCSVVFIQSASHEQLSIYTMTCLCASKRGARQVFLSCHSTCNVGTLLK